MKKLLITAIGAAVAFGAFADAVRFEESGVGPITALSQLPGGTNFWSEPAGATNTYAIGAAGSVTAPLSIASGESSPTNALDIKTTFGKPLSLYAVSGGATTNINDGLYFDSLVKFTVCDAGQDAAMYADAKIVMWLEQTEDESKTNLIVRAGYLSLSGDTVTSTPTNYVCTLTGGIDVDAWHRVTIKAIADITTTGRGVPGFAIYLDENGDTAMSDINVGTADTLDGSFPDSELTEAAYLLNNAGALFPSLDVTSGNKTALTAASFDGTGSITDLIFTENGPAFAQDMASDKVSIKIGDNTEQFTTLDAAIAALNAKTAESATEVTFKLIAGMTLAESPIAINNTDEDVEVVIDLNGCGITNSVGATLTIKSPVTIIDSSANKTGEIVMTGDGDTDYAILVNESGNLTLTAGTIVGYMAKDGDDAAITVSGGTINQDYGYDLAEGKVAVASDRGAGFYEIVDYVPPAPLPTVAENPWYKSPGAVVLAQDLPHQGDSDQKYVAAFHGQGAGSYLGLTYSTNPLQFDLFGVNGTNALTTIHSVATNDVENPGFRGVAISETLGVAMTLAYAKTTTMYTFPLESVLGGNGQKAVTKSSDYSFDAAAFSPDGNYLFSNIVDGPEGKNYYAKWTVSADENTGALALVKVGTKDAGGRGRSMAYARINGRDLVFGLVDTGKVVVMDMTDADPANWTATALITDLPAHSYGTLCVSGVNVVDAQGNPATPHLTVATSTNNGATKGDVLNVYALTVPATGAVTASLTKSFDEDALTAAGFGDISDAQRYGNTVYVTDDEATIYFARPDNKLYAAQFAYVVNFVVDGVTNSVPVFPGATVAQADPTKENYIFDGWFAPGAGQAYDLTTPVTQDLTLEAQFTAAEAKVGSVLYLTLKDAVDAADTGDTVTVLADCSVTNGNVGITFTKGINIVNNYTITIDGANYALRIANGTTTPVTWSGTGSLVWLKGSGSPIIVGSNELKAKYGINSYYEGSFVLNGGTLTSTDATATGGNLVKLEAGTFVLNDGMINGGTRGVKADSEGNNATCVLTINGGTIVNTNTAAIAASTAGSGSSTVTINAGTFTGAIVGTGMVTIPGTSTAKFDRDQDAFCESGYETTLSDGWYVVKPSVKPIVPDQGGSATYVDDDAATAAAAAINANKETLISVDSSVTGEAKTTYLSKVQAVANGNTVTIQFTTAAETEVQTQVDGDTAALPLATIAAATGATEATVTATPGCYYTVKSGTEPGSLTAGTPVLATGTTVTLPIPNKGAAGFYKIEVKPTK